MRKIIFLLFVSTSIFGQINISRLSFDFNYIKNYQLVSNYEYSYSPEIKVGGLFFSEILEWEIYTSYWDDGISEPLSGVVDYITFTYSNLTTGSRIYFLPTKMKFHLLLNAGFSYKYIIQKYISGSQNGIPINDKYYNIISLDFGVGFRYRINSLFRVRAEYNHYTSINGDTKYYDEFSNHSAKIGIDYFIK